MKTILISLVFGGVLCAQAPTPSTVVATVAGKKVTAGELEGLVKSLPPNLQQFYERDKREFVKQLGLMMVLTDMAEKEKLPEQTPHKERLAFARMQALMQSYLEEYQKKIAISNEDIKKAYDASGDRFTRSKVFAIYLNYSETPVAGKVTRKEAEAKTLADELVKKLRAGANFTELAKANSDDVASREKGGEFGTFRKTDQIPEVVKNAIFALKAGEVSEPVKQPGGFYIFKGGEVAKQPFEEVKDQLSGDVKQQKFVEWFQGMQKGVEMKVENEAFFGSAAPPPPGAPPPAAPPKP